MNTELSEPTTSVLDESIRRGVHRSVAFKGVNVASRQTRAQSTHEFTLGSVLDPWSTWYKTWWALSVIASVLTVLSETFQMAFPPAGLFPYNDVSSVIEYVLLSVFFVDILINFNLAYELDNNLITDRKMIAEHYIKTMFVVDVIGVFPFYPIALAATGQLGKDTQLSQLLGILRLLRLVRVHRVLLLFERAQYSTKISLMWLTLIRNFTGAFVWTHVNACIMYFIAKLFDFDPITTWIGDSLEGMSMFERYVTALYYAVTTFATVGKFPYYLVYLTHDRHLILVNVSLIRWFHYSRLRRVSRLAFPPDHAVAITF